MKPGCRIAMGLCEIQEGSLAMVIGKGFYGLLILGLLVNTCSSLTVYGSFFMLSLGLSIV
jgi:hypothetical protein